ncbi:hypothetical protein HWV62_9093 [Athelia sp. TMB]|nr:hypothetical protein HWV62_9093 [Athelia sp. TMB]
MPSRRPSASVAHSHAQASAGTSRAAHRQPEAHFMNISSQNVPINYSANSPTPQQKVVQTLINRIKSQLPSNSGLALDHIEGDKAIMRAVKALVELCHDSMDIIAYSLSGLLEGLAQKADLTGQMSVEVLQSQLFVLKVLSMALAAPGNEVGGFSPGRETTDKKPRSGLERRMEPLALDERCAQYILSVIVLYLRQTTPFEGRLLSTTLLTLDSSFSDFESVDVPDTSPSSAFYTHDAPESALSPKASANTIGSFGSARTGSASMGTPIPIAPHFLQFSKTHMSIVKSTISLNKQIGKYAGLIIRHLSASNWPVVFARIRSKLDTLSITAEENPDTIDLQLMNHSAMDRSKLIQVLQVLSSLLINMKQDIQVAVARPLRVAIWNWIDLFPEEFNDAIRNRGRMEGAPERTFEVLHTMRVGAEKDMWPTLTLLSCISSEHLSLDFQINHFGTGHYSGQKGHGKGHKFLEEVLKHANTASKFSETALICAMDMCKVAWRVSPDGEVPLRVIGTDIAHEIKTSLYKIQGKPFWELTEDIDIGIYAEALSTAFRFIPEEESMPLFLTCLEPERSDAVKIVAARAATTLVLEGYRNRNPQPLANLAKATARRFRSIYKSAASRRNEADKYGNPKRSAPRPKARRNTSPHSDRDLLLLSILALWRTHPNMHMSDYQVPEIEDFIGASLKIYTAAIDKTIKISFAASLIAMSEMLFTITPAEMYFDLLSRYVTLAVSVEPLLALPIVANGVHAAHVLKFQQYNGRVPAFALSEVVLLVSLTSVDKGVAHLAAQALRYIAIAEMQADAPSNPGIAEEDRRQRHSVYTQLGDPNVIVFATNVAVWEECFWRWNDLCANIAQSPLANTSESTYPRRESQMSQEDDFMQWRNLTLFLAAFSGVCCQEDFDPAALQAIVPAQILPDDMRTLKNPKSMVERFVKELTDFLIADSARVREVAREALGSELSPSLYGVLFKHLEEETEINDRETESPMKLQLELTRNFQSLLGHSLIKWVVLSYSILWTLIFRQFTVILKMLVDKPDIPPQEVGGIDISETLVTLTGFIARYNNPVSHRIRIKLCALCDSICERTDTLILRSDTTARQEIVDMIMDWIQDTSITAEADIFNHQSNLNIACIRSAVSLMKNLDLRVSDAHNADGTSHNVARLFIRYSTVLLKSLHPNHRGSLVSNPRICQYAGVKAEANHQPPSDSYDPPFSHKRATSFEQEAELQELVIAGLAHLIRANTEIGVKHCLPLAHDGDPRKRIIFSRVFARVLKQGTTFDPIKISHAPKQDPLCTMLLALAICDICPSSDVDVIISLLMDLFDTRSSLVNLVKLMVDREIAHTDNDASLFRGNSTTTRFLSAFAKIHGYNYLRSLISPLVEMMAKMPPGHSYELNPDRAMGQDVHENQKNVEAIASGFLDIITLSVKTIPPQEIWPESKFAALGAFIFLRFISPAVVAPSIVDVELPKENTEVIRKGLMVIAKVIQNLANNIFFGKEQHMTGLNDFLKEHIVDITRYLSELNKQSAANAAADESTDEWLGTTADETDAIVLHRFFHKHGDKIGKELLSRGNAINAADSAPDAKLTWVKLCEARVGMGSPERVPEYSFLRRDQHPGYISLMERYMHRNSDSMRDIFVEMDLSEQGSLPMFVLRLCNIDVEAMDVELFIFHIFKACAYGERQFSVILDCTAFTSASEMPFTWLTMCAELIPSDVRERFKTTYILNPNAAAHRYLRKLYNICAGTPLSGNVRAYSTVAELLEHIPEECTPYLSHPVALEDERLEVFRDATMRQSHQMRMPVRLAVGVTHIRITSAKAQPLSPSLACRSTEIIYLKDVNDIYNVSTGQDPFEFIIRRIRQGVTLYFSSTMRETITIRMAKSQMQDGQLALVDRGLQISDVSATLLNIGLLNIDSEEEELRSAAYDLLGAICTHIGFDKQPMVTCEAGFIPEDPNTFVNQISHQLANFVPKMTLDFITEVASGMDKAIPAQRINCLQYMRPWIPNLAKFCDPSSPLYEHSGAKLRDVIRLLVDLTTADHGILSMLQKYVWSEISQLDVTLVNVVLDELMRAAIDGGAGSKRCEVVARTVASLSPIIVRGRIFAKLRKILAKTALKPTRNLEDNYHWLEIAALTRLAFVAGNHNKPVIHTQLYIPEIVHLVTLISGTGPTLVRKSVYGIIFNYLQSVYGSYGEGGDSSSVLLLLEEFTTEPILRLFGLTRTNSSSEYCLADPTNDRDFLETQEKLTALLIRVMEVTAGTNGLLNAWKARWIGLIASMAFQHSPAIQSRAFIALGSLATSDVDDDFMYQIVVAFKVALAKCSDTETASVVCMLRCICQVVPALSPNSKYTAPLFWLAVALLQSSHIAFYSQATELLRQTLLVLEEHQAFGAHTVPEILYDARMHLEDTLDQLDHLLGLSFESSFSFSLSAIIFKAIRHSGLKECAETALRNLLQVTVRHSPPPDHPATGSINPEALGYFLALIPVSKTPQLYLELVESCNVPGHWDLDREDSVPRISIDFLGIEDEATALLVVSFVGAMIANAQGDETEDEILWTLLSDVGGVFPDVVAMAYDGLQERVKYIFANSSNGNIIKAVSHVFRIALGDSDRLATLRNSASTIGTVDEVTQGPSKAHLMALDELGMRGLASSFQFVNPRVGATKLINWIPELVAKILEA